MLCDLYLRPKTINAEERAQKACGHWMAHSRKPWIVGKTPEEYYSRHERRPAPDRTDRLWTIAIIVILFVAGALAGAIAP
jgi:hypothetical protein